MHAKIRATFYERAFDARRKSECGFQQHRSVLSEPGNLGTASQVGNIVIVKGCRVCAMISCFPTKLICVDT